MTNRDKIKSLTERERCRDKVSIWFGSRDNFIHPFKEALANSIDEINNNFDKGKIIIKLEEDNTITIKDTGRGIQLEGETDGVPNYELLLLKLFAGTNYENGLNGKITTGTNGCGMTVTNYCSSFFSIKSYKNRKVTKISFKDGGKIDENLTTSNSNLGDHTGTTVSFKLDEIVFGDYKYDVEEIKDIIKNCAGVNNKIIFEFQYKDNDVIKYYYDNIEEFFLEENTNNTCKPIIGKERLFENKVNINEETITIEKDAVELILSTSPEINQKSFLNVTYLSEGGSINDGVVFGVREFVNKYATEKRLLDKKLGIVSNNDIRESISFVCNMLSTVVEYANQTKLSTNKSLYQRIVWKYTVEILEIENIENPKNIERLVKHILEVQKFNNKAKAAKNKLKSKLSEKVDSISNRIEKLTDCKNHGEDSELFISEGDSANGSIVLSRNADFQACLAIRGKIMNILKKSYTEIFESQTVMDIMKSLGCGIETNKKNKDLGEFHEENLRYGKIILATDADPDGFQIQCLLLSLFYKLTPTLIKKGRIYIAITPLYEVRLKDDTNMYWFSEEEKEEYLNKFGNDNIKKMSRCKGLGELDPEIMSETGVNPETRNIIQVTVEDVEMMIKSFDIWMDDDASERYELLTTELNKFDSEE